MTLSSDNTLRVWKNLLSMSISEKIETVNNKIEQNKAQYNLDRQTAKVSALSSGNICKYEFLTEKHVLREKDLLERAAALKRFEYSPLGKELKKQTSVEEQQYQSFDKVFNHDENEKPVKIKKERLLITDKSSLVYDSKYSFSKYRNVGKYYNLSFMTKYDSSLPFYHRLNEFRNFAPRTEKTKIKKKTVYNNAINLYITLLTIYFNQYNNIANKEKEDMDKKYDPSNLLIKGYRFIESKKEVKEISKSQPGESIAERVKLRRQKAYDKELFYTSSSSTDENNDEFIDIPDMPPLQGDEEVTEGKGLKILIPNKFLTRLPILLAQIKAGNNSYKLKNGIRQILYLSFQHNKITKEVYKNLIKSL